MSYKDYVLNEVDFEMKFFEAVAGTDKFEIIPISYDFSLKTEDLELIETQAKIDGLEVLYKISHGNVSTVYCAKTGKTGIIPETNTYGFDC